MKQISPWGCLVGLMAGALAVTLAAAACDAGGGASGDGAGGGAARDGSGGGGSGGDGAGGGASGDAAGGAPGDGDGAPGPVRIIRGDPGLVFHDLTMTGVGLDAWNGKTVTAQIGAPARPPERLGWGQAAIAGGAFTLRFPGVLEDGLYKSKVLFVDVDGNGSCGPEDRVFIDSRSARAALTLTVAPDSGWNTLAGCNDVVADWPDA